ncbi:hypothetical protein FKW77_004701 [Venturia effusa]|uniref:Uncharacterized protein n=1 Tax=Venturia effusa TaxID=50376 RepID=A0A517L794_9PEZI|nr:hypothetical protein FKW77_004701 [Venturia effusa]
MTNEERLVFYLQHLEENADRGKKKLADSVLFTAMTHFPGGRHLVTHLLDFGCSPASKITAIADPSNDILSLSEPVEETLTTLIWSIGLDEPKVHEDVCLEILSRGKAVDFNFETETSKISALHLASGAGLDLVVQKLTDLKAPVSRLDPLERSPLFYASRNGCKEAAEMLLGAGCRSDDGSLHEAAREAHEEIVKALLANRHRADFPSPLHLFGDFGLTPLEELCLRAEMVEDEKDEKIEDRSEEETKGVDDEEDVEEEEEEKIEEEDTETGWQEGLYSCIEQLLPAKGANTGRTGNRTILHMAFHNKSHIPALAILLKFPVVWENLNHAVHLYRNAKGLYYSPTKYFESFCLSEHTPEVGQEVLALLKRNKCEDKYYAHTVLQPEGAVGLPLDISQAVDKKARADFEHAEAVARQEELVANKRAQEAEDYHRRLATDKNRHDRIMAQRAEQDAIERAMTSERQSAARSHAEQLARERLGAQKEEARVRQQAHNEEARFRQQALVDNAQQRQAAEAQAYRAEQEHRRIMPAMEVDALRNKLRLEEQVAQQKAEASRAEAQMVQEMLDARQRTADYELRQMREAANYRR